MHLSEPQAKTALVLLQELPTITQLSVCEYLAGRLVLMVDAKSCGPCLIAAHSESVVTKAVYGGANPLEWTTISTDAASLRSLLGTLRAQDCSAEIVGLSPSIPNVELTGRQREVLSAAVNMGYFDEPRRIDLRDLALRFGISRVAARELLRKAERKLLHRFL